MRSNKLPIFNSRLNLDVFFKDRKALLPLVLLMQVWLIHYASAGSELDYLAHTPTPKDHNTTVNPSSAVSLSWVPASLAVWQRLYLGTTAGLDERNFIAQKAGDATYHLYTPGFASGQTYYWRIDTIDSDNQVHTGTAWTFTTLSFKASSPNPSDGAKWIPSDAVTLSWQSGLNATQHEVFLGTSQADVAAGKSSTYLATLVGNDSQSLDLGKLQNKTLYYWRVDEIQKDGTVTNGDLWHFTTLAGQGGIQGRYYDNSDLAGAPVLTRIDEAIDLDFGEQSPAENLPSDGFSIQWVGELEVSVTGIYTFTIVADDGVRLWIDDQRLINDWTAGPVRTLTVTTPFSEAQSHSLRVDYFDAEGQAQIRLLWQGPDQTEQVIPSGPIQPPYNAYGPGPARAQTQVRQDRDLSWKRGYKALQHDVYFGSSKSAVAQAQTGTQGVYRGRLWTTGLEIGALAWNTTYYWRVDEVNDQSEDSPWTGQVWSFTTADHVIVDDFEDYNDVYPDRIFETWIDGSGYKLPIVMPGNGSGATVGHLDKPYAEETIVHQGLQSMPLIYDNSISPWYSEAERTLTAAQDWSQRSGHVLTSLQVAFHGAQTNTPEDLYLGLEDNQGRNQVLSHPDNPDALLEDGWAVWTIPLTSFSAIDLTKVTRIFIGVGNRETPLPGGSGILYIDDIGLHE